MPSISKICTVLPTHRVFQTELPSICEEWLPSDKEVRERFTRLAANAGVKSRYFVLPYREMLKLRGLRDRAVMFDEFGTELLNQVLEQTLSSHQYAPESYSHFLYTSCSMPAIPAPESKVIVKSRLSPKISRVPMFQHGCAGGVVSLALAAQLARSGRPVLASSLELCSMVFQPRNLEGEQLVGAAIFGDGAAMTVVSPDPGLLNIIDSQSYLIPETGHLMGYYIFDDGFHLRLDRSLPSALASKAPEIVTEFLKKNEMTSADVNHWLFHPGGKRILDFLQGSFSLQPEQCRWSYEVLRDIGNLSSATIYFVLQRFMEEQPLQKGEQALVVGIGPGLTVELILLRA